MTIILLRPTTFINIVVNLSCSFIRTYVLTAIMATPQHITLSYFLSFKIDAVNDATFGPVNVVLVSKSAIILSVGQNFMMI